ncbi:MAG: hypothetical protein IKN55_07855, partial [Oscillospiraceae bacterium]|nr:hypothetical protein [Oscillospiraceae bacterium]
ESKVFSVAEAQELSNLQYTKLCEAITGLGYVIVPDEEIVNTAEAIPVENKQSQNDPYEKLIKEFDKLSLEEKYKCLVKLVLNIAAEDEKAHKVIAEQFVQQVLNMRLQYSYIAVFLKAFFAHCNALGKAKLSDMIDYAADYYRSRIEKGIVAEKADSVLSKAGFEAKDVRQIALFNPLKRSFIENYFTYDKAEYLICINVILWDTLSNYDKTEVLRLCDEKLASYYEKIS